MAGTRLPRWAYERVAHQDRVVALRAGGQQGDGRLHQLLDPAHVFDRLRRQLRPGPRAAGGAGPALDRLVHRPRGGLRAGGGRQVGNELCRRCRSRCNPAAPQPSSTSSLVSARPLMPPTLTAWRTSAASNQPQRRGRPVTVPNSCPRSPSMRPVSSGQLGRERAAADARAIRLGDAQHEADRGPGRHADAARGGGRHRVAAGDERVGAVVHVQHDRLRALEQDALPGPARLVQALPHRLHMRQDARRQRQQPSSSACLLERLGAQAAQQRVVVQQQLVQLVGQRLRLGQVAHADGAAGDLVLVGRADAAARGADLAVAARRLPRAVQGRVQRQDQRGVVGDAQIGGRHVQPLRADAVHLRQQRHRVDHDAVADHAQLAAHQAGRQQAELVGLVAHHQRVPGVVAALEAHHDIRAAGQPVHDLALALVAPLGADHRHVCHGIAQPTKCGGGRAAQDVGAAQPPASAAGSSTGSSAATVAYPSARSRAGGRVVAADRHEQPRLLRRRRRRADAQHGVRIQRQPGGRLVLARQVAPAAAQHLVPPQRIHRGADAGVVRQVAELQRVDGQLQPRRAGLDGAHRVRQPGRTARRRAAAAPSASSRASAGPASPVASSSVLSVSASRPPCCHHGGDVLAVQRAQQQLAARPGEPCLLQQGRRQARQGQVEADAGQPQRGQRLGPDQHHLGIGGQAVAADQLDPGLGHLAVRRDLAAAHAQAVAGIGQAATAAARRPGGWRRCGQSAGVMSARRPIMRCDSGSIRRKTWSAMAAPDPVSRPSSNSSIGGLTRS